MKAIEYISNKQKRAVWLRAFHIWQQRPHELAPLSEESRTCSSCGTVYQGNFCPRCGQSARVGRFSFKKAALLFLDVWGMGNRSMFRSLRDLMLRPGFMIRDYLRGMQSAYFPPFKMFFLLAAFSLVVEHGFNFGLDVNDVQDEAPKTEQTAMENTKIARHDLTVHAGDKKEDIKYVEFNGKWSGIYKEIEDVANRGYISYNDQIMNMLRIIRNNDLTLNTTIRTNDRLNFNDIISELNRNYNNELEDL